MNEGLLQFEELKEKYCQEYNMKEEEVCEKKRLMYFGTGRQTLKQDLMDDVALTGCRASNKI